MRRIASRQHHLDQQQSATGIHRAAAMAQNRLALRLAPIVDDVREEISITADRNAVEEAARLDRHPLREAARLKKGRRVAHDVRQIVENSARGGRTAKDRAQQMPCGAADVHNGLHL